jgi:hypothetical protein
MTIYDNGCYNPMGTTSSLIELNPFLDANKKNTGRYVNPPDAGYDRDNRSNQVVWHFETFNGKTFYSHNVSSTQRLPNGNTLACAGAEAHIFEVTRDGEVVWEYINPLDRVFRAYRYGVDYPAFKGKTLKPRGTISELLANVEIPAFVDGKGKGKKGGGKKGGGKKGGAKEEEEPREERFLPY